MKKFSATLFFLLTGILYTHGQDSQLMDFEFSDEKIEIPEIYKNENEVFLQKDIKIDILTEENSAVQYFLIHEKKWINSDEAIERNNKVYVPFRSDESLLLNKVRVINENGKTIELNPRDIMEEMDEEQGIKYNYYAINGLTRGSVIEKIFLIREAPDLEGNLIGFQDEIPVVNATFELIYPSHLVFKYKSYNGLAEAETKTNPTDTTKISLYVSEQNLNGLKDDESYGNWERHIKKFKYKLDQNLATNRKNLYNYVDFAKNVYDNVYVEPDKKDQKAVDNFLKQIKKSSDPVEQIKLIENKIKSTITYNKHFHNNQSLSDVLNTKQANALFTLRLYAAVLRKLGIEHQMVFTSRRYANYFDKDFESTDQLSDVILYFPKIDQYMDFLALEYRMPLINFNYSGNYGLFVSEKEFGGAKMGIGSVQQIKVPDPDLTHDKQNIVIDFTKDIENPEIHTIYEFTGYSALNFQPIKDFLTGAEYDAVLKDFAQNYTMDTEFKSLNTKNDGLENIGFKPYILEVKFDGVTQKAGNTILFKAGETIGRQMELYQEHARILPVEIYYPHAYTRTITVKIPEGYSIKNPESFNFDKKLVLNGKTEAAFISSYVQKGNELIVTNEEFYNVLEYPLEVFEKYREVINAAADFNKITLVLSKD